MSDILSQCVIGLNECSLDDYNMRLMEAPSCGCLLVTNYIKNNGFEELGFEDQVNCMIWKDLEDFEEVLLRILGMLRDPNGLVLLANMARSGCHLVRSAHTYQHRVRQITSDFARLCK